MCLKRRLPIRMKPVRMRAARRNRNQSHILKRVPGPQPAIQNNNSAMPGGSILIDHYRQPRCRGEVENATCRHEVHNRKCGDRIVLTSQPDAHGLLRIRFEGQGCMYCLASASILCSTLSGKPTDEARLLIRRFRQWIRDGGTGNETAVGAQETTGTEAVQDAGPELTDGMRALGEVKAFPMRIDCADLAWKCADEMLETSQEQRDRNVVRRGPEQLK